MFNGFDKKELKRLVDKAIGNLSKSKFAEKAGISRTYVSEITNMKLDNPPQPQVLKKIAENSENKIKYKDLMAAAGYLEGIYYTDKSKEKIEKAIQEDAELYEFWQEIKNRESMKLLFKQTRDLSDQAIKDVVRFMKSVEDEAEKRHS